MNYHVPKERIYIDLPRPRTEGNAKPRQTAVDSNDIGVVVRFRVLSIREIHDN